MENNTSHRACMFDTDNDGLEDGEEVIAGADNFVTHANNSDTDDDGLIDGDEILFIPRPFQRETNPLINDTDADGMLDGWEMQVKSTEDNKNSHSLWVAISNWDRLLYRKHIEQLPHGAGWLCLDQLARRI